MRSAEFGELRMFATVAELGSYSRAAEHLHVTPSAISQAVRRLERRIGVRLLDRTTRSVAASEHGVSLLARINPLMAELDNAVAELGQSSEGAAGRVRVSVPRVAVSHFIAPCLASFRQNHPRTELEIAVSDVFVDLVKERFDAGIRLGEQIDKDMLAVKLQEDISAAAVASPEYLERRGCPKHPSELESHECIRFRWPGSSAIYRWEFEVNGRPVKVGVSGGFVTNDVGLMLSAAMDGIGIAYVLETDARPFIESRRLVPLLKDFCPPFPGFHLYHTSRQNMTPALRAFIDHCVAYARQH